MSRSTSSTFGCSGFACKSPSVAATDAAIVIRRSFMMGSISRIGERSRGDIIGVRVVPPQDREDRDERQRSPLVTREIPEKTRLRAQEFGQESIREIADEIDLDELAAKDLA